MHSESTLRYILCDAPVVFRVGDKAEALRIEGLLQRHFALAPHPTGRKPDDPPLEIVLCREHVPAPQQSDRIIEETPYLRILHTRRGFRLEAGESSIDIEPSLGVATGRLSEGFWDLPELAQRDLFLQTLVILLRDRHLYGLHSSGVVCDGTGLLVAGPSGQGKTTLTLGLMAAGGELLGDDVVALRQVNGAVEALAVRLSMSCTPTTLAFFGMEGTGSARGDKRLLDIEFSSTGRLVNRFHPKLVVFPEVTEQPFSELEQLDQPTFIAYLVRSMAGIMTDPVWAERQLGVLANLAHQAGGYRMLAGRDVYEDPPRVTRLLNQTERHT